MLFLVEGCGAQVARTLEVCTDEMALSQLADLFGFCDLAPRTQALKENRVPRHRRMAAIVAHGRRKALWSLDMQCWVYRGRCTVHTPPGRLLRLPARWASRFPVCPLAGMFCCGTFGGGASAATCNRRAAELPTPLARYRIFPQSGGSGCGSTSPIGMALPNIAQRLKNSALAFDWKTAFEKQRVADTAALVLKTISRDDVAIFAQIVLNEGVAIFGPIRHHHLDQSDLGSTPAKSKRVCPSLCFLRYRSRSATSTSHSDPPPKLRTLSFLGRIMDPTCEMEPPLSMMACSKSLRRGLSANARGSQPTARGFCCPVCAGHRIHRCRRVPQEFENFLLVRRIIRGL